MDDFCSSGSDDDSSDLSISKCLTNISLQERKVTVIEYVLTGITPLEMINRNFQNTSTSENLTKTNLPKNEKENIKTNVIQKPEIYPKIPLEISKSITMLANGLTKNILSKTNNEKFIVDNIIQQCNQDDPEVESIKKLFLDTTGSYKVQRIDKILNPYIKASYLLKIKENLIRSHGIKADIKEVFHGTKASNVNSIAENNFDWRRYGDATGNHYFGKGVNFSPLSSFSSHYVDKGVPGKCMIMSHMIIANKTKGKDSTDFPPILNQSPVVYYDTTTNHIKNSTVYVKYRDDEFCPLYVVWFANKKTQKKKKAKYVK